MRTLLFPLLLATPCMAQIGNIPGDGKPSLPGPSLKDPLQIAVETVILTGPPELFAQLKADDLIRTPPQREKLVPPTTSDDELAKANGIRLVSASSVVETRKPIFVQSLTNSRKKQLLQSAQGQQRANVMFAPKVTVFDGQEAVVSDITERPFVVGLTRKQGDYAPSVTTIKDGTQIAIRTSVKDKNVKMDLSVLLSDVSDVHTTSAGPVGTTVQVPSVQSTKIDLSALVKPGESLAIIGFQTMIEARKTKSFLNGKVPFVSRMFSNTAIVREAQEMLVLITPIVLDLSDATD